MKQRPVTWFRRLSLVLAILGIIGGVWLIVFGLFLERRCPEPYVALNFTGTNGGGWICLDVARAGIGWDPGAYPQPAPDMATAGFGVAVILFFLWAYSLCLAVARKLEDHPTAQDSSPGQPTP